MIKEINQTIRLLENNIPANPAASKNESIEKGFRQSLAEYYNKLDNAIDINKLEQIYYRHVEQK